MRTVFSPTSIRSKASGWAKPASTEFFLSTVILSECEGSLLSYMNDNRDDSHSLSMTDKKANLKTVPDRRTRRCDHALFGALALLALAACTEKKADAKRAAAAAAAIPVEVMPIERR